MATSQLSGVIQHLRSVLRDGAGLTDGQLLEDYISRRDEATFAVVVRRHGPMVWGVCRRVLHSHHDAEDAFQATFLVLVRRAASIASRELLANWLYGVAHQTALKARATAAKRKGRERQVTDMPEPAVPQPDQWRDLQPLLDEELSRLPDKYRAVIVLCDLAGKTRKEAAGQLGCAEGTVASRLARARNMLAKRLTQRGVALSGGALAAALTERVAAAGVPASVVFSTIKAASLFVAGKAATTGAISVKVAALTEGVLKTMLMSKLKFVMAVLAMMAMGFFGAGSFSCRSTAAGQRNESKKSDAVAPKKDAAKSDTERIQGTWRLLTSEIDGLKIGAGRPEIKDSRLVIDKSSVTMMGKLIHSPNIMKEPEDVKAVGTFTLDTKKNPKVIVFIWETNPWLSKEYLTQRGIYTLEGDSLKLCFYLPGKDTKLLIPTDFSAKFGSKRSVSTFQRVPPSDKGGERKPEAAAPQ